VKGLDFDRGIVLEDFMQDLDAFGRGEKGLLAGIFEDGDDDPGEEAGAPADDILVTICDRIEGPGIYRAFFYMIFRINFSSPYCD